MAKTLVALIAMFNLSIVLLAEYTTIGSIFKDFVGTVAWGIVLSVALITMAYTAYGEPAAATILRHRVAAPACARVVHGRPGQAGASLSQTCWQQDPGW